MELHGPSPLCLCPALRKALLRVRGLAIVTLCHLRGVCGERSPFSSWGVEGLVGEKGDSGTFSGHGPLIPTAGHQGCWGQARPCPQASGGTGPWPFPAALQAPAEAQARPQPTALPHFPWTCLRPQIMVIDCDIRVPCSLSLLGGLVLSSAPR